MTGGKISVMYSPIVCMRKRQQKLRQRNERKESSALGIDNEGRTIRVTPNQLGIYDRKSFLLKDYLVGKMPVETEK